MVKLEREIKNIPSELALPLETLITFFDAGHPNEHRKDLKKWRFYVINDEPYKCRHGAGHVLAQYEETLQLIHAAHDLMNIDKEIVKSFIATHVETEQEKRTLIYFPTNLKKKEVIDPMVTIRKFFKTITLDQYKDILHEWLRLALSNKAATETLTAKEIIDVYDNLRKLYSAIWIIHCRVNQNTIF